MGKGESVAESANARYVRAEHAAPRLRWGRCCCGDCSAGRVCYRVRAHAEGAASVPGAESVATAPSQAAPETSPTKAPSQAQTRGNAAAEPEPHARLQR